MAVDITIEKLTNGSIADDGSGNTVWVGTGIFDTLISAINSNIKIQYDEGRLSGADYASVYLGSMQSAIAQSMHLLLEKDLRAAQIRTEEERLKGLYVDRVMRDKQATVLGLDNAISKAEIQKNTDPDYIYTPQYESTNG